MKPLKSIPKADIIKETGKTTLSGDVLGYARVSIADQDVAAQEDRLRQTGAIRIFADVISRRQFERPGLSALIDHARPGDSLCVTRLDRSLKELLETVENLKAHDIHLVSLKESIDTTSAAGELVFHVFGAIAHFERRLISERTRRRYCGRQKTRQEARSPATRPGDRLSRANPCRGWLDAGTGRETAGHWQGHSLQDRQGGTLKLCSRVTCGLA